MKCDLCKRDFNPSDCGRSCKGCSSKKSCSGLRCPFCFYEVTQRPAWLEKLVTALSSFVKKEVPPFQEILSLASFRSKRVAEIVGLETRDRKKLQKILSFGAIPGARIELLQKFPSFIMRIGMTLCSLDRELAECIYVREVNAA